MEAWPTAFSAIANNPVGFLWQYPKYQGTVNPISRARPIFGFIANPVFGWRVTRLILQTSLLIAHDMCMTPNILNVNPASIGCAVSIVPWNFLINFRSFKPWWIV